MTSCPGGGKNVVGGGMDGAVAKLKSSSLNSCLTNWVRSGSVTELLSLTGFTDSYMGVVSVLQLQEDSVM